MLMLTFSQFKWLQSASMRANRLQILLTPSHMSFSLDCEHQSFAHQHLDLPNVAMLLDFACFSRPRIFVGLLLASVESPRLVSPLPSLTFTIIKVVSISCLSEWKNWRIDQLFEFRELTAIWISDGVDEHRQRDGSPAKTGFLQD